jgi:flavin-dependent dehydrogenase
MKHYDVVVVGAGPGGCMTAKVLSENGFKVALLERKNTITKITRACATMMAIENERYINERMYYNEKTKKIVFPETSFSVDYDGPYRPFYSWNLYSPNGKHCIQLGDYKKRESEGDRLSITYCKSFLLEGLLRDAVDNGCEVFPSTNVVNVSTTPTGLKVYTSEGRIFEGTFVVAADGINSRIARLTGLNKKRIFYSTGSGVGIYFNKFKCPYPNAFTWLVLYHPKNNLPMAYGTLPCPYPDAEYWLWVSYATTAPEVGADLMEDVRYLWKESPYAHWFEGSEIVRHNAFVWSFWSPAPTPYLDNIIFVGDAPWTGEAECTGSMMGGWKAAHAITLAFRENKLNQEGVMNYITWWRDTFPNFHNYKDFIGLFATFEALNEEDMNYIFSLATEPLECTLNPYRFPHILNGLILQKIGKIQQENPQLLVKLQTMATVPLEKIFVPSTRRSFLND